jgi:hypothetical protein
LLLDAVHEHSPWAETETMSLPPPAPILACDRSSVNWQGAASCVMVIRCSLTTTTPLRERACALTPALTVTSDSPWPDEGVTWIHETSLERFHEHSRAAVTITFALPPP